MVDALEVGPDLLELWMDTLGSHYPLGLRLLKQNAGRTPNLLLGLRKRGRLVGFVQGRNREDWTFIDALAVHPDHRSQGLGTQLLETAVERLRAGKVRLGGGPCHYFPGIPQEFSGAQGFFARHSFEPDWSAMDLRMRAPRPGPVCPDIYPCPESRTQEMLAFVEEEFPGRWSIDARHRAELEGTSGHTMVLDVGGAVAGFCQIWEPSARVLGPSVFWRALLDSPWGGIGPVGVGARYRGRGLGLRLVRESLCELSRRGVVDLVVDWTGLEGFYSKAGFTPWKRYRSMLRQAASQDSTNGR